MDTKYMKSARPECAKCGRYLSEHELVDGAYKCPAGEGAVNLDAWLFGPGWGVTPGRLW